MLRFPFQGTMTDQQGHVIAGGTVTVYLTGTTTLAEIFAAETGGSAISGSVVTSDSNGAFKFWIDNTTYASTQRFRLVLNGGAGFASRTLDDVAIIRGGASYLDIVGIGTGADTNHTKLMGSSVPADTLSTIGQGLRVVAFGTFANTATVKTVKLTLGTNSDIVSNSVYLSSASIVGSPQNVSWKIEADILYTGTATQAVSASMDISGQNAYTIYNAGALDMTALFYIGITGQNGTANANDIICRGLYWKEIN